MANTEIHTSWPKHMVKPHDKREPVNIHNTYLIGLVQNHYCGFPELLNDYITIIGWRFCDIQNNIGSGKGYQLKLKAEADNPYQNVDYTGYHKNWI